MLWDVEKQVETRKKITDIVTYFSGELCLFDIIEHAVVYCVIYLNNRVTPELRSFGFSQLVPGYK